MILFRTVLAVRATVLLCHSKAVITLTGIVAVKSDLCLSEPSLREHSFNDVFEALTAILSPETTF